MNSSISNKTATCFVCLPLKGLVRPHVTGAFLGLDFQRTCHAMYTLTFAVFQVR